MFYGSIDICDANQSQMLNLAAQHIDSRLIPQWIHNELARRSRDIV